MDLNGPGHRPAAGYLTGRAVLRAAATTAASGLAVGLGVAAAATVFARRLVTPETERADDVEVVGVTGTTVTLRAAPETTPPGRYGLWQDQRRTHARLGPVESLDAGSGRVTRALVAEDRGRLRPGPGRWNHYYYSGTPSSALGLDHEDVEVPGPTGPLPGWLVPAASGRHARAGWAILVHGRGATREECLRALPVLNRLGLTALVAGYRTTAGLPAGLPDGALGRYHLGDTEWQDVEAAIVFAAERGAADIVLFGWSMGGAIVMQTLSRSWTAHRVRGVVLDAPVLDWRDVLDHQARLNRVPPAVGRLGQFLLSHRSAWRLTGTQAPVDLDRLDWLRRAAELTHPVLLVHSDDDDFVPSGPSRRFAAARPDLVTYLPVTGAPHCAEWNVDPERWDAAVARFLLDL